MSKLTLFRRRRDIKKEGLQLMKVVKNGDTVQKRTHEFECWNCKCEYIASNGEWYYVSYCQKANKPTDHVESVCPECGTTNKIQWRYKKRDCLLLLLSLGGMIVSGISDSIVIFIISFIMLTIYMIIKE